MKKLLLYIILLLFFKFTMAQEEVIDFGSKKYLQKISVLTPGVSGELSINNYKTINLSLYTDLIPFYSKGGYYYSNNYGWEYRPTINLSAELRHYMKTEDRIKRGKRTDKFSGAYGSLFTGVGIGSVETRTLYAVVGPKIGFQRAIGNLFYWNVNLGVGPIIQKEVFNFTLLVGTEIGFAF